MAARGSVAAEVPVSATAPPPVPATAAEVATPAGAVPVAAVVAAVERSDDGSSKHDAWLADDDAGSDHGRADHDARAGNDDALLCGRDGREPECPRERSGTEYRRGDPTTDDRCKEWGVHDAFLWGRSGVAAFG
jgi:hypothetical protein